MISESYLSEASRVPAANQAADAAILTNCFTARFCAADCNPGCSRLSEAGCKLADQKGFLWNTKSRLKAHKIHSFKNELMKKNKINYIRINIFPDGGISRIRLLGKIE